MHMGNTRGNLINPTPIVAKKQEPTMKNYNVSDLKTALQQAQNVQIVVPNLSVDGIASALALGMTLKKANKQVAVYCPQTPDANYSKLAGMDLLTDTSAIAKDLTISVDFPLDQIEKVSYNDDGGKLNLVVQTKPGSPKVETEKISIQNQNGPSFDLTILLGDPTALGEKSIVLQASPVALITPAQTETTYAYTILDPEAPFSEIFSFLIPMLGYELDIDPSKNLLVALRVATQGFSINISPESFEAAGICLRASQLGMEQTPADATPIQAVEAKEAPVPSKPNPIPTN